MADPGGLLGLDAPPDDTATDYLGRLVPVAFRGQPALPVTGGAAVGAPAGPSSPATGQVGASSSATGGGGGGSTVGLGGAGAGGPNALGLVELGLNTGKKFSDLARIIYGGNPPTEAITTPSGQQTISAPEILRGQQFPEVPDVPGGTFASEGTGAIPAEGFDLGGWLSEAGFGAGTAAGLMGLVRSIEGGNVPGGVTSGIGLAQGITNLVAPELASALALPVAYASILASVLPGGLGDLAKAAERRKGVASEIRRDVRNVPVGTEQIARGALTLRGIKPDMSDQELQMAYDTAAQGISAGGQLADAFAKSGATKAGLQFPDFGQPINAARAFDPMDMIAVLRLQDMMQSRGLESQFGRGFFTPADLLWSLAPFAGFNASSLQNPSQDQGVLGTGEPGPGADPGNPYNLRPEVLAALSAIPPGQTEQGVKALLGQYAGEGFSGSPLGQTWEALGGQAATEAAPAPSPPSSTSAPVLGAPVAPQGTGGAMTPGGGGEADLREALGV